MKTETISVKIFPESLNNEIILQRIKNGLLIDEFRFAEDSDFKLWKNGTPCKMGYEWQPVKRYLIDNESDGEIVSEYAFLINGGWAIGSFDDLLGSKIERVSLVLKQVTTF